MVMENPLITIVTVCKNNIDGLRATEGSIRSQSDRGFEWVVIDGASTDGTNEYLSGLDLSYLRIWIEADESQFEAMNKGIERSQGEYVLFLNAGDSLHDALGVRASLSNFPSRRHSSQFSKHPPYLLNL